MLFFTLTSIKPQGTASYIIYDTSVSRGVYSIYTDTFSFLSLYIGMC